MVDWLEYTSEKIESEKEVLYRTRYSVDFSGKKKGELSGYISKDVELPEEPILIGQQPTTKVVGLLSVTLVGLNIV